VLKEEATLANIKEIKPKKKYKRWLAVSIILTFLITNVAFADMVVNSFELEGSASDSKDICNFDLSLLDGDTDSVAVDMNKEVDIAGVKVNFKRIEATPSETRIYYEYDLEYYEDKVLDTEEPAFMDFDIDDLIINGQKYSALYGRGGDEEVETEEGIK